MKSFYLLMLVAIAACSKYSFSGSLSDSTYINHNYGNQTLEIEMFYHNGNSTDYVKAMYDNQLELYYGIETLLAGNISLKASASIGSSCNNSSYYIFDKINNIIVGDFQIPSSLDLKNITLHKYYTTNDPVVFTVMSKIMPNCIVIAGNMDFIVEIN